MLSIGKTMTSKLRIILLFAGAIGWGIAVLGVLLPWKWMLPMLQSMGAAYDFSDHQVQYWLRMACGGWSIIGFLFVMALLKPKKYGNLVSLLAIASIFEGFILLIHGLLLRLTLFPFAGDVLFCLVVGFGLLWTERKRFGTLAGVKGINEKKQQMLLLIGIPASGKSTFASMHIPASYQSISLDILQSRAKEAKAFTDAIANRRNIVIDNTNVSRAERQRFIEPAKAAGYEVIGYFFKSVINDCLERNAQRLGRARIPDVGVVSRAKELELPSFEEGFDGLYYVTIVDGDFSIDKWQETR